jgi:hypothetical protein
MSHPCTSAALTRRQYVALRNRFVPKEVKIVFIRESPPASGKYFYNPAGSTKEPLFRAMMGDVLGINPLEKKEGLRQFAGKGYFLIDSTYTLVNALNDKKADDIIEHNFDLLIRDLTQYAGTGTGIVLVKANVCRLLEPKLAATGFNILNHGEIIPFPGTGQQGNFRAAILRVLASVANLPRKCRMTETSIKLPLARFPFTASTYPGRRPRFSFLFTQDGIHRLKLRNLDTFLRERNLPPVTERYAVVAYGSNACPGQLIGKKLTNVPVIFGHLVGAEAVYARRTTSKGYMPATLARKGGERSNWVTLLTRDQLRTMDTSEGRQGGSYDLAELPDVRFRVGRKHFTPLYAYVNIANGVMALDGMPVGLRSMKQKKAKLMRDKSDEMDPADCLDFNTIPAPDPPARYSQLVRV